MTCSGDVLDDRQRNIIAGKQSDFTPCFVVVKSIEIVTGSDATFTAGAGIEIDFKGILLAGLGLVGWDQRFVVSSLRRQITCCSLASIIILCWKFASRS